MSARNTTLRSELSTPFRSRHVMCACLTSGRDRPLHHEQVLLGLVGLEQRTDKDAHGAALRPSHPHTRSHALVTDLVTSNVWKGQEPRVVCAQFRGSFLAVPRPRRT
eukprot:3087951-Pleurochrysis_carterae.AAC.1